MPKMKTHRGAAKRFKKTGTGAFGWQRVSNIATVRLCLDSDKRITIEANK